MNPYDVIREAVFTERSTAMSESDNIYTFKVCKEANKMQIREAVELAFNVKVADVRTISVHPKRRIDRYRGIEGKTKAFKKALVKLAPGHSIEFA